MTPACTAVHSIKNGLVALRMSRALEVLDATLRRMEQGEIDGIEALDQLLIEELTVVRTDTQDGAHLSAADHDQITRWLRLCLPALSRQTAHSGVGRADLH